MKTPRVIIDLAIAFDQNYLIPSYVLLTSLFSNNAGTRFQFHVIATGISATEKKEMTKFVTENHSTITFYVLGPENIKGLVIPKDRHYTIATYYRLFFYQLVPADVNRLLYLDTDLIVNGDISELYFSNLNNYPVAAVRELSSTIRPELEIYESGACLNAGVLLIDIPEWKKQKITERALDFVFNFPEPEKIKFADQDALNVILKDNYYQLDSKYNVCFYDVPKNLTTKQYKEFANDKIIIHYTLTHKPWNPLGKNRLRFLYFQYLKLSPKAETKRFSKFAPTAKNLLRFIKLRIQEAICDYFPPLARHLSKTYLWRRG